MSDFVVKSWPASRACLGATVPEFAAEMVHRKEAATMKSCIS